MFLNLCSHIQRLFHLFVYSVLLLCVFFFIPGARFLFICIFLLVLQKHIAKHVSVVILCPLLFICSIYNIYHHSADQSVPLNGMKKKVSACFFLSSFFRLWFAIKRAIPNREIALKVLMPCHIFFCFASLFPFVRLSIDRASDLNDECDVTKKKHMNRINGQFIYARDKNLNMKWVRRHMPSSTPQFTCLHSIHSFFYYTHETWTFFFSFTL